MIPSVPLGADPETGRFHPEVPEALSEHLASPRRSYQDIKRRQNQGLAVLAIIAGVFLLVPLWGPYVSLFALAGFVVLLALVAGFDVLLLNLNWSCPRCGKFLGSPPASRFRDKVIRRCAHCGYKLR